MRLRDFDFFCTINYQKPLFLMNVSSKLDISMAGKVSLISGGASGLGFEIARILAESGKNVIILGRNSEKLETAVKKLESKLSGNFAEALTCNIGDEDDVRKVGEYLVMNKSTTEYLFNNAGSGLVADARTSTQAMIDAVFEANLKGMILLTSEILRITPEEEELTIVNIMSTSALIGRAQETVYCAAKFGARGYTEALRNELKGKKRNIIAVYPGGMRTDFWKMPGHNRDTSKFMDPAGVALKIVNAVQATDGMVVTDITINRK
jgi:short-subunit dehydrogenase